jgi:ABC-type glycerol-3-phosphate transport system substrate-binding protein
MRLPVLAGLAGLVLGLCSVPVFAATEIVVWHAMNGVAGETFADLVNRFNTEQKAVHVTLEYKGDAKATVDAAAAAAHTAQAPDLVEVQDEVTERLLSVPGAVRPMFEILPLVKSPDFNFLIPSSVNFMRDAKGRLYGFPYRASVPVLLYNRDAYQKYGLDPDQPPRTWHDLQNQLVTLQAQGYGYSCAYTTSEQSWIHIENLATWHGESFASKNNGLEGPGAVLTFNDLLHVRHIAILESWSKAKLFQYFGHEREGDEKFTSGECATLTTGSDALGEILAHATFKVGVAPMPFYEEGAHQPNNTLVNGSAFWAMAGKKPDEYKADAEFLAFLATPVVAAEWTQKTGALPLTTAALRASVNSTAYARAPGMAGVMELASLPGGSAARGVRLPNFDKVRDAIDAELETVWAGQKPAKEALDDAVREGDLAMHAPVPQTKAPVKSGEKKPAKKVT